jgi:hypothetical protein
MTTNVHTRPALDSPAALAAAGLRANQRRNSWLGRS